MQTVQLHNPQTTQMAQNTIVVGIAALVELAASVTVVLAQATAEVTAEVTEAGMTEVQQQVQQGKIIFDDKRLVAFCVMGAMAGALLTIAVLPSTETTNSKTATRQLALKFFASMVSGMVFSPMVFRYWDIDRNVDTVLAVSAGVALIAVSTIQWLVPWAVALIKGKIQGNAP